MDETAAAVFEKDRKRLSALAYRMLGSVAEAEDVVQDAYLRWHRADRSEVANPGAFLARIVTRLSLDRLKEARRRRETYVGTWLPEPLVTELSLASEPVESVADDISYALLLALERLSPLERAAFLLHDVFDVAFEEVAVAIGRSPTSCRQLASRARSHLREDRPRYAVRPDEQRSIADAFFAAVQSGNAAILGELLAHTATFHSDGGGKRPAALNVVVGGERIARLLCGIRAKWGTAPSRHAQRLALNGLPGLLTVEPDGTLQTTALEISEGRVVAIYVTRNPDKLAHLMPLVPEPLLPPAP